MTVQQDVYEHIMATFTADSDAEAARADLTRRGFPDGIAIFRGLELTEAVDATGKQRGRLHHIGQFLRGHLSEETNYLRKYEDAAEAGNTVISVHVKNDGELETAKRTLLDHSAIDIRYFGRLAVRDLTPLTNPSQQADHVPNPSAEIEKQAS